MQSECSNIDDLEFQLSFELSLPFDVEALLVETPMSWVLNFA